jgi:hypothetical protein
MLAHGLEGGILVEITRDAASDWARLRKIATDRVLWGQRDLRFAPWKHILREVVTMLIGRSQSRDINYG